MGVGAASSVSNDAGAEEIWQALSSRTESRLIRIDLSKTNFEPDLECIGYSFYRLIWLPGALKELAITISSSGLVRLPL